MKSQPTFLESVISHIDCAAVPELIIRLVNAEAEYEGKGTLQWLVDQDFPRLMISRYCVGLYWFTISRFSPEYEKLQSDLARTIIEIVVTSSETSPLLQKFYSSEIIDLLLELVLKENNNYGFRSGMAVFSQLLRVLGSQMHDSELPGVVTYQFVSQNSPLTGSTWFSPWMFALFSQESTFHTAKTQRITDQPPQGQSYHKPVR